MKKRIFCLLLAVLMLVGAAGVFTSCGDDPGKKDPCTQHVDANKDNKCDECGETMTAKCTHEDADEDGKCDKCGKKMVGGGSEVVEYPWADDEPVKLLFQMTKNSQDQSLPATAERYLAGEDPTCVEEIDAMVRDRNAMAAAETNIVVSYQYYPDGAEHRWGQTREKMLTQVLSGASDIPDVYCNIQYDLIGASVKGAFANLKSHNYNYQGANYFNFLKDGWYQEYDADGYSVGYMYELMKSLTLNEDKMYILGSDYFMDLVRAFLVMPVHVGLLESVGNDITGDLNKDGKFTIDDFYQEVKENKWTYNKLIAYSSAIYDDTNKDGAKNLGDTLGVAYTSGTCTVGMMYTTSVQVIEWNDEDGRYAYPEESPDLYSFFDAVKNLVAQKGVVYDGATVDNVAVHLRIRNEFVENRMLFGSNIMLGALEYTGYQQLKDAEGFGVVPLPLYHEVEEGSDESYLTAVHNAASMGSISAATRKFAECTAFLNYQSEYRGSEDDIDSNDILIQYYDFKLQYDVADGSAGTIDMLRYIRSNVRSSFEKYVEDLVGCYFNATHDRWHVALSDYKFSGDIRPVYGEYSQRKDGYLKTLIELYNSNDLPS